MQRLVMTALTTGLCLALSGALAAPATAAPSKVVVKGHVTSPSGRPIAGVVVKVVQRMPGRDLVAAKGRTSATGRYEVTLPAGTSYQLVVSDPGDADGDPGDGAWAPASRRVTSSGTTVRIDATMQPGARISGHVVGPAGEAVRAGLPVRAYRLGGGVPRSLDVVGITLTRSNGVYRFSNLPAGPTLLSFESGSPDAQTRFFTGTDGGAVSYQDATPIALVAGAGRPRQDFRFVPQRDPLVDLRPDGAVDPVGDAPDFLDITDLRVANGAQDLVVRTTIPKLDPAALDQSFSGSGDSFSGLTLIVRVKGVTTKPASVPRPNEFVVSIGPGSPNAPIDTVTLDQFTEDDLGTRPCPGIAATVEAGLITATVPQSCFGALAGTDRGAVKVQAGTRGDVGPQGSGDETIRTRLLQRS